MSSKEFKEKAIPHAQALKEMILTEYFSEDGCLSKQNEQKLLTAIRKIGQILEEME